MKNLLILLMSLCLLSCGDEPAGKSGNSPRAQGVDSISRGNSLFFDCREVLTGITVNVDAVWSDQALYWTVSYQEKTPGGKVLSSVNSITGREHSFWPRIVLSKGSNEIGYIKEVEFDVAQLVMGSRKLDCVF